MQVTMVPRNPTVFVESESLKNEVLTRTQRVLTNDKDKEIVINFLNGKAVKSQRKLKQAIAFVTMTALVTMADVAHAQELNADEQKVIEDIDMILLKVQLICGGIAVGFAVLMAMIAGFFRIVGLREEAKKRYKDAVAGMVMVLTAPVVLGLLATVVRGFIRLFPDYAV